MNKIPGFFIVGAPKAGTTSLYHYLEEHPDVYMSPIKETNYFSYNEIKEQDLFYSEEHISNQEQYLAQFSDVKNEKAIGEASVSYLFYNGIAEKIKAFNPDAKIIIVLRNPVDRGFSHYLMDQRLGLVNVPYEKIVHKQLSLRKGELYYQQYVSLGLYYRQLKNYLNIFDRQNIKILFYEDIISNIKKVVYDIYVYLNVSSDFMPDTDKKHNTFEKPKYNFIAKLYSQKIIRTALKKMIGENLQEKVKNSLFTNASKPVLSAELKKELVNIYSDDINKTAELLKRDLSHWLT